MKLSEIYQTPDDTWDEENEDGVVELPDSGQKLVSKIRSKKNHKYLGSGSFAYVGTNDDNNFGDVHRIAGADDGGSMYLKYLADHPDIMDNPFFPRVRKISGGGRRDHQVSVVERLLPFRTEAVYSNGPLIRAIWKRYFNITVEEAMHEYGGSFQHAMPYVIRNALVYNTTMDKIKDENLISAIRTLKQIKESLGDVEFDLHQGNIMWRMAGYQPQLVFTDPFVF